MALVTLVRKRILRTLPAPKPRKMPGKVARVDAKAGESQEELKTKIKKLLAPLKLALARRGQRVLIKPNFVWNTAWPCCTDLKLLEAAIELVKESGAIPIIGESANWDKSTREVLHRLGYLKHLEAIARLRFFDEEQRWVKVELGTKLGSMTFAEAMFDCDRIIYLCNLKCHSDARFTGALKLSMGALHPRDRLAMHLSGLEWKLADINLAFQPSLVLMDARKSYLTEGPCHGELGQLGFIFASPSRVAADVVGLGELIKFSRTNHIKNKLSFDRPQDYPTLRRAAEIGLEKVDQEKIRLFKV